jgi:hypothetical protein
VTPDAEAKTMGWATAYIERLRKGETMSFRPRGSSMSGKIESGQLCTVVPVDSATLKVGDVVLCKVNGREYLHLIKAVRGQRFQIGNNRGRINGWVAAAAVFGKCVRVED